MRTKIAAFLDERGLALRDDFGAETQVARYLAPKHRLLAVSNIERVARGAIAS